MWPSQEAVGTKEPKRGWAKYEDTGWGKRIRLADMSESELRELARRSQHDFVSLSLDAINALNGAKILYPSLFNSENVT